MHAPMEKPTRVDQSTRLNTDAAKTKKFSAVCGLGWMPDMKYMIDDMKRDVPPLSTTM